jgi:predicted O-methyltransferase YrrM
MTQGALSDNFVYREFKKLIETFNINKIIETGTYYGWSSLKLAEFDLDVITIENSEENFKKNS